MNNHFYNFCAEKLKRDINRYKQHGGLTKPMIRRLRIRAYQGYYPLKSDFDAGSYLNTQQHLVNVKLGNQRLRSNGTIHSLRSTA